MISPDGLGGGRRDREKSEERKRGCHLVGGSVRFSDDQSQSSLVRRPSKYNEVVLFLQPMKQEPISYTY